MKFLVVEGVFRFLIAQQIFLGESPLPLLSSCRRWCFIVVWCPHFPEPLHWFLVEVVIFLSLQECLSEARQKLAHLSLQWSSSPSMFPAERWGGCLWLKLFTANDSDKPVLQAALLIKSATMLHHMHLNPCWEGDCLCQPVLWPLGTTQEVVFCALWRLT